MERKTKKKKMLLAASVAGLLALTGALTGANVYAADVACEGINACKGQGACGGKDHACAGKNACKGMGITMTKTADECSLKGGKVPGAPVAPAA